MKTFVICMDSFKAEYLKYTPFLKRLTQKNAWGNLETIFAYTGIGAAVISGKHPDKTGIWREFCFSKESPFKHLRYFRCVEDTLIGRGLRLATDILFNLWRYLIDDGYYTSTRKISFELLSTVKPTMKKGWCQRGCLPVPTIFDYLRSRGVKFFYHDWPSVYKNDKQIFSFLHPNRDEQKIDNLIKEIPHHDFFWIRLWDLDTVSHRNKPGGQALKDCLVNLDNLMKKLFAELDQPEIKFLFWSDHGMVEVKENFDIGKILSGLKTKYLTDSTSVRFHNVESGEELEIKRQLKDVPGYFLDNVLKHKFKLGDLENYGDLIFLADPGVCFVPNSYSSSPVKGMHGYNPTIQQQKGFYLTNMTISGKNNLHITDLFNLMKSSL